MGRPVVHFEIIGREPEKLRAYYGELFGWTYDVTEPMNYGLVAREDNLNKDGIGIGGGVGGGMEGYDGHVTVYVEVPDVEEALQHAERLGGTRMMGPERVADDVEIGIFADPEGHGVGLIKAV